MKAIKTREYLASVRATPLGLAILVVIGAALFMVMPVNPVAADESMTIKGAVASVDSYDKTFSVVGPGGKMTLGIDKATSFTLCDRNKGFENLASGQKVIVTYHSSEAGLVADVVDISPITLACYNQ